MKKTPEEMAEHIRAAINNANAVMQEAADEGYLIEIYAGPGLPPIIEVESIKLNRSL